MTPPIHDALTLALDLACAEICADQRSQLTA